MLAKDPSFTENERPTPENGTTSQDIESASMDCESISSAQCNTENDEADMRRLGKKQELARNFRPVSALSFAVVLQATWEFMLVSNEQGLQNGGTAGLFWTYLWTFIGFSFVVLSVAEQASMAPTAGGQYHWVSQFGPQRWQRFLSYIVGWQSVLAWQAGSASGAYLTGSIIQGLIAVNDNSYEEKSWRTTLLIIATVVIILIFNIYLAGALPTIQNILLVVHVMGFIAIIVILWVLSDHKPAKVVLLDFYNGGGWPNAGLSVLVGQISAIYGSLSIDASAHMAEEIKDAGINVPETIACGYFLNGILGLGFIVTYCFAISNVQSVLERANGSPFLVVFEDSMGNIATSILTAMVLVIVTASNIAFNATTSRQTFAFARDKGMPFSSWLSQVSEKRHIPTNAIVASCLVSVILSLINIGSDAAFNAIVSLNVSALYFSYGLSMICILWRRIIYPKTLPVARWSLGRAGPIVNAIGILYLVFGIFFSFWPADAGFDQKQFNWSSVMFAGVMVGAYLLYILRGHRSYRGPAEIIYQD